MNTTTVITKSLPKGTIYHGPGELGFQHMNWVEGTNIQTIASVLLLLFKKYRCFLKALLDNNLLLEMRKGKQVSACFEHFSAIYA